MSWEYKKQVRMNLAREASETARGISGEPVVTTTLHGAWVEFPATQRSYVFRRDAKGRLYFKSEESLNPHASGIKNARSIAKAQYTSRTE
jgi:hypothetical protein